MSGFRYDTSSHNADKCNSPRATNANASGNRRHTRAPVTRRPAAPSLIPSASTQYANVDVKPSSRWSLRSSTSAKCASTSPVSSLLRRTRSDKPASNSEFPKPTNRYRSIMPSCITRDLGSPAIGHILAFRPKMPSKAIASRKRMQPETWREPAPKNSITPARSPPATSNSSRRKPLQLAKSPRTGEPWMAPVASRRSRFAPRARCPLRTRNQAAPH